MKEQCDGCLNYISEGLGNPFENVVFCDHCWGKLIGSALGEVAAHYKANGLIKTQRRFRLTYFQVMRIVDVVKIEETPTP